MFYFQKEACEWAWELLTERIKMEKDRLYVTYFGGNEKAGLEPDTVTRDIWISLGYVFASLPESFLCASRNSNRTIGIPAFFVLFHQRYAIEGS